MAPGRPATTPDGRITSGPGPAVYLVNVPAHTALPIWETTELNPLIPSPVAVIVAIILGGLVVLTAVALVVFVALRLTPSPRGGSTGGDER
jgi:hypothetical protein